MNDLEQLRHSTAHVLASAVLDLFPEAKLGIGPPILDGFYYDFDLPRPLTPDDLPVIEARMRDHIAADEPFESCVFASRDEALDFFTGQPYKQELIRDLPDGERISLYRNGAFVDLCRGEHLASTGQIPSAAFRLQSIAGAYWRGDEQRPMLQRIYGTAWPSKVALDDYLRQQEVAAERDHRKLGRELDLYSVSDELGSGLILWHPKGAMVRHLIEEYWKQVHLDYGYDFVYTPHIGSEAFFSKSGHLSHFSESMYSPMDIDGVPYYVKPMNCPCHILIYNNVVRSYRDLPLRFAELGTVYRYERSGSLHGMLRVRGFTQDDSHLFCTPEQVDDELDGVLDLIDEMARTFGYEYRASLATRPERSIGTDENWADATAALRHALGRRDLVYEVEEGGGAFYGPKIDILLVDALGRGWQGPTVQLDFNLPERFDATFVNERGERQRVVMLHRTIMGSTERFVGGLIEHYGGAFPVWLAPVQATVIPVADRHIAYANKVAATLRQAGIRVGVADGRDRMNHKIREAQVQKVPYMLIVGDREEAEGAVNVRLRTEATLGQMPLGDFIAMVEPVVATKSLELTVPARSL
jgi:threonyl-tRNA synthetase